MTSAHCPSWLARACAAFRTLLLNAMVNFRRRSYLIRLFTSFKSIASKNPMVLSILVEPGEDSHTIHCLNCISPGGTPARPGYLIRLTEYQNIKIQIPWPLYPIQFHLVKSKNEFVFIFNNHDHVYVASP